MKLPKGSAESVIEAYLEPEDEEMEELVLESRTELEFLYRPSHDISFYHREYNIDPLYTQVLPWQVPSRGLEGWYLLNVESMEADILNLDVALCDWGVASWSHKHYSDMISPPLLRSPEVLIGAPWNSKTDIWTFAAGLINVMGWGNMFSGRPTGTTGEYDEIQHLHEITVLCGPFPKSLLKRGTKWFVMGTFDGDGFVWGAGKASGGERFWDPAYWQCLDEGEEDRDNFSTC